MSDVDVRVTGDLPPAGEHDVQASEYLDDGYLLLLDNIREINKYYMPVVIFVGLAGNALSVLVFLTTKLRVLPSSHYLTALAVADTGVLIGQFIMRFDLIHNPSQICCRLFIYASYIATFLSVWFVVSFTVERFIVVRFPMKRYQMCTVRRARTVIVCIAVLGSVLNLHSFVIVVAQPTLDRNGENITICNVSATYIDFFEAWNYFDLTITMIIPMLTIVCLNITIAQRVLWYYPRMFARNSRTPGGDQSMIAPSPTSSPNVTNVAHEQLSAVSSTTGFNTIASSFRAQKSKKRRSKQAQLHEKEQRITRMLLVVSVVFVVMNLPDHIVRLLAVHVPSMGVEVAQSLTNALFSTSFAVNFFLYNIVGVNFRQYLREMIVLVCRRITGGKISALQGASVSRTRTTTAHSLRSVSHNQSIRGLPNRSPQTNRSSNGLINYGTARPSTTSTVSVRSKDERNEGLLRRPTSLLRKNSKNSVRNHDGDRAQTVRPVELTTFPVQQLQKSPGASDRENGEVADSRSSTEQETLLPKQQNLAQYTPDSNESMDFETIHIQLLKGSDVHV